MALGDVRGPPTSGHAALLLIDLVNPIDVEGAEDLLGAVFALAHRLARVRDVPDAPEVPIIYLED